MRIMVPDSKRGSCQRKDEFYGMDCDFSLQDTYRALDVFPDMSVGLQRWLSDGVKILCGRDMSYAFYDATDFFFNVDFPDGVDGLSRRGVSKEHMVDPMYGSLEYTREGILDGDCGKVVNNARKRLRVDREKAEDDVRFTGHFCIVTSELEYDEKNT